MDEKHKQISLQDNYVGNQTFRIWRVSTDSEPNRKLHGEDGKETAHRNLPCLLPELRKTGFCNAKPKTPNLLVTQVQQKRIHAMKKHKIKC